MTVTIAVLGLLQSLTRARAPDFFAFIESNEKNKDYLANSQRIDYRNLNKGPVLYSGTKRTANGSAERQ
jgi:hypothetical protein